jgi:cytochrome-b5 reductase
MHASDSRGAARGILERFYVGDLQGHAARKHAALDPSSVAMDPRNPRATVLAPAAPPPRASLAAPAPRKPGLLATGAEAPLQIDFSRAVAEARASPPAPPSASPSSPPRARAGGDAATLSSPRSPPPSAAAPQLVRVVVQEVVGVSADTRLLRLRPGMEMAACAHVYALVEGEEKRPYTPLAASRDHVDLLVKSYGRGTSRALHALRAGDSLQLLGPICKLDLARAQLRKVALLAAGTGVTPMFQLLQAMAAAAAADGEAREAWLVYCNKSEGDILLRRRLEQLADAAPAAATLRLHLHLRVTRAPPRAGSEPARISAGRVDEAALRKHFPPPGSARALLCGPPPFCADMRALLARIGFDDVFEF